MNKLEIENKELKAQLNASKTSNEKGVNTDRNPRVSMQVDMQRKLEEAQRLLQLEREGKKKLQQELEELKQKMRGSESKQQMKQDVRSMKRATSNYLMYLLENFLFLLIKYFRIKDGTNENVDAHLQVVLFKEFTTCVANLFSSNSVSVKPSKYHPILEDEIGRRQFLAIISREIKKVQTKISFFFVFRISSNLKKTTTHKGSFMHSIENSF